MKNLVKSTILRAACCFMRFVLRLHGWSDSPRPEGFSPACKEFPFWRWRPGAMSKSIDVGTMGRAVDLTAK